MDNFTAKGIREIMAVVRGRTTKERGLKARVFKGMGQLWEREALRGKALSVRALAFGQV